MDSVTSIVPSVFTNIRVLKTSIFSNDDCADAVENIADIAKNIIERIVVRLKSLCRSINFIFTYLLVGGTGVEPARVLPHNDLNVARIPIPPPARKHFLGSDVKHYIIRTGFIRRLCLWDNKSSYQENSLWHIPIYHSTMYYSCPSSIYRFLRILPGFLSLHTDCFE